MTDRFLRPGPIRPPSASLRPRAPSPAPLTLTTTGGSGTGGVSYVIHTGGTASGCAISSGALTSTSAGTCIVTATKAADADFVAASSAPTPITLATATPTAPTIGHLPTKATFGGSSVLTVTGPNTNDTGAKFVTSNSTGVCTVSGNLSVTYVGVGTCSLTAQIAANSNYLAASGSPQSFTVAPAPPATPHRHQHSDGGGRVRRVHGQRGDERRRHDLRRVEHAWRLQRRVGRADRLVPGHGRLHAHGRRRTRGANYLAASGLPADVPDRPRTAGVLAGRIRRRHLLVRGRRLPRLHGRGRAAASGGRHHPHHHPGRVLARGLGRRHLQLRRRCVLRLRPRPRAQPGRLGPAPQPRRPDRRHGALRPTGRGYFMVASDGGVFAFGDAKFEGSCPGIGGCAGRRRRRHAGPHGERVLARHQHRRRLHVRRRTVLRRPDAQSAPVVNAVATPDGSGYWLLYANGVVVNFGDAANFGFPAGYVNSFNPANAMFPTADGQGYWVASTRGDVFAYGNAPWLGSMTGRSPQRRHHRRLRFLIAQAPIASSSGAGAPPRRSGGPPSARCSRPGRRRDGAGRRGRRPG